MAEYRKLHESTSATLLFFLLFLGFSSTTTTSAEIMPMQLSREELVRIAGYGEEKLSSVLIMGSILCETCRQPRSQLETSYIAGAKVAVACKTEGKRRRRRTAWAHGTTDEYGEFMIDVPSELHALPALEEACIVRIMRLPRSSHCLRNMGMKSRPIKLSSVGNSIRVYTTGAVRLNQRSKASHECLKKRHDA